MAGLSLALSALLATIERHGATPAWLRGTTAVCLTVVPANGLLPITIWKDVPYSIAHVAVAALSFALVRTRGAWYGSPPSQRHSLSPWPHSRSTATTACSWSRSTWSCSALSGTMVEVRKSPK
jgi:hypothetical protein